MILNYDDVYKQIEFCCDSRHARGKGVSLYRSKHIFFSFVNSKPPIFEMGCTVGVSECIS